MEQVLRQLPQPWQALGSLAILKIKSALYKFTKASMGQKRQKNLSLKNMPMSIPAVIAKRAIEKPSAIPVEKSRAMYWVSPINRGMMDFAGQMLQKAKMKSAGSHPMETMKGKIIM
jgi:hypothetical protein